MIDVQSRLPELLELTHEADSAIMEFYDSDSAIAESKADGSPITQADRASHQILVDGLERLFPGVPVVSEEGDQQVNASTVKQERFWLVDPIDGTKEFIRKIGEFTVCVALIEAGTAAFGVISVPAQGITYYGGPGLGSFKKEGDGKPGPIHILERKIGVIMGSRSHSEAETQAYVAEHYPDAKIESVGSQLKFPYIAEGRADAYPRLGHAMKLWDLAAGHAILAGAGGMVSRPDGSAIDYNNTSLLAGDFVASS